MSPDSRQLAYFLDGQSQQDDDLYVMINAQWKPARFKIQKFQPEGWNRVVDTSLRSPFDICEPGREPPTNDPDYRVQPRSIVVLRRSR